MKIQKKLLVLLLLCSQLSMAQTIRYVKPGATGTGTSWANASGDIQNMINASVAGDQIWIAAGTYKPNRKVHEINVITPGNPYNAFLLKAGVKLYGGFAGTESSLADRNWSSNLSILSGHLGTSNNIINKSYHVIVSAGNAVTGSDTATLDGFTVRDGRADQNSFSSVVNGLYIDHNAGAGIYTVGNGPSSAPIIANCTISNDSALAAGAGIYNWASYPVIKNCIIKDNVTYSGKGGGICNDGAASFIYNTTIINNTGGNGGGVYNADSSSIIKNCIIDGNTATGSGGGIYNCCSAYPQITNCKLVNNTATYGGGIYNWYASAPAITNCTIAGNTATGHSGGIYNMNSGSNLTTVRNCIIWGNSSSITNAGTSIAVTYSLVESGFSGTGNSSSDPLFVNAAAGDYTLQALSPAVDQGSNAAYGMVGNINTDKDLGKRPRLTGTTIDIGAYELCTLTTGTDIITACGSYTWINGVTYTANNNTATDTLINAAGCDSVVTLNLTINTLPGTSVTDNGHTATAAQAGASYQWINCATNQAIAGATNQSFAATTAGNYKVAISLNGCSDTSDCINLTPTSIKETDWEQTISIFPNPAEDIVTILFNHLTPGKLNIHIMDLQGRVVFHAEENVATAYHKINIDLSRLAKGSYIIKIRNKEEAGIKKLILH